ncbi:MAG TPA: MFS transporter [Syntrophomonas sp.]|nr:MFS transporter [Syntrophomonas sp.]
MNQTDEAALKAGKNTRRIRGKHLTIAVACCLIAASAASYSTFFSFFLVPVSTALNIDRMAYSFIMSVVSITGLIFAIVWGQLLGKVGIRRVILICCTITTVCFLGFAFATNITFFYILAAIMGIGTGGGTTLCAATLVSIWFQEKRGQVMSIVMACINIGGVVGGFVIPAFIASFGWQMGYIIVAVYFFVLTIPAGIFMVRNKPQDVGLLPFGVKDAAAADGAAHGHGDDDLPGISFGRGMKSPTFYLLFLGIAFLGFPASFIQHISAFGTDQGLTPEWAGMLIVVVSLASIVCTIIAGQINDKIGPMKTTLILEILFAVSFLAFFLVTGFVPLLITGIVFSFGLGFTAVMPPILVGTLFGPKDFSKYFGLLTPAMAIGFVVGTPLLGSIYDQNHSYNFAFILCIIFIAAGVVCIASCLKASKKLWAELQQTK